MEKRVPHYPLSVLKARITEQKIAAFTATALFNIATMRLSLEQAMEILTGLTRSMFYKSMTTHADSRIWQDVYHAATPGGKEAYIKLTLHEGSVVIQFKEK